MLVYTEMTKYLESVGVKSGADLPSAGDLLNYIKRLKIHHTPKYGSWLNMAEIEFSALSCQCLDRQFGTLYLGE